MALVHHHYHYRHHHHLVIDLASLDPFDQLLLWCHYSDTNQAEVVTLVFDASSRSVKYTADHVTWSINEKYKYEIAGK
jgi:hypothetical protein